MVTRDEEQVALERWLQKTCLERLAGPTSRGLSEAVLCATVSHRVPPELGTAVPSDVKRALKRLQDAGRVTHSAGRWRRLR